MKKRTLLTCGLAAALFAGCSSDDKLTVDDGTVSNGTGYVSLRIALPSTSGGMRADNQANDQYGEGDADEYKVNDVTLVFFNENKEVLSSHTLTTSDFQTPSPSENGITTQYKIPVQTVSENTKFVLVLLNKPDDVKTDVATFEQLNKAVALSTDELTGAGQNDFFMSNTTLASATDATTQTLVPVITYKTTSDAEDNARVVYVERAVGKIEMSNTGSAWDTSVAGVWQYTIPSTDATYPNDIIKLTNWGIDFTNKQTYPVRVYKGAWNDVANNTTGTSTKRMLSTTEYTVYPTGTMRRTYWAEDPNYNVADASSQLNKLNDGTLTTTFETTIGYCPENTFDVTNMTTQNTTRVLLKATYVPKNIPASDLGDGTWYLLGNSTTPKSAKSVIAAINEVLGSEVVKKIQNFTAGVTASTAFDKANFLKDGDVAIDDSELSTIKSKIKSITTYAQGTCYYVVKIQHFGSYYTPWGNDTNAPEVSGEKFYNYTSTPADTENDNNYLGRYGVVRNNWYQLELKTISAPGTPTIPLGTTDSDDTTQYYISANIKIMDWAVRKQSVNL